MGNGVSEHPVILFCFAGRRANMELQLPLVRRILKQNTEVEYHIWDLARDYDDSQWLRTIEGERISVIQDFSGFEPWKYFDDVYRYYSRPEFRNHLFVKVDDDVIFMQTERFGDYLDAVDQNRESVVSAKVINNGACAPTELGIWAEFQTWNESLLDVHQSARFGWLSHRHMFTHVKDILAEPIRLMPTADWLSINMIGYDWEMGTRISEQLGQLTSRFVAGRDIAGSIGDEGAVNMLPRLICQGFLAAHLSFGPQQFSSDHLRSLREHYATIGQGYLDECVDLHTVS